MADNKNKWRLVYAKNKDESNPFAIIFPKGGNVDTNNSVNFLKTYNTKQEAIDKAIELGLTIIE